MANQVVKLKDGDNYLYPYANFMGIDTSNILKSFGAKVNPSTTYVATQDSILMGEAVNGTGFTLDGVLLGIPSDKRGLVTIPLKKGQSIYINAYITNSLNVYGIKY